MFNHKITIPSLLALAAISTVALAQSTNTTTKGARRTVVVTNLTPRVVVKQGDVASKTASFGKIARTDEAYKTALDAHALADALKQVNKEGAFKGKVSQIFEPRAGGLAIVNFDTNYRSALTALVRQTDFKTFPPLTNLIGKEVVVSGKYINYQGRAEVVLTNTAQVKLVE